MVGATVIMQVTPVFLEKATELKKKKKEVVAQNHLLQVDWF